MSTKAFSSLRIKAGEMDDTFLNNPKSVAGQFSSSTAYAAGDYVYYNNKLYRFTAAHAAGAWTGSDASEATVSGELSALKADLTELELDLNSAITSLEDAVEAVHEVPAGGTSGQILTKASGSDYDVQWSSVGMPSDAQVDDAVSGWLDNHPEATTTVEDGSITKVKLHSNLADELDGKAPAVEVETEESYSHNSLDGVIKITFKGNSNAFGTARYADKTNIYPDMPSDTDSRTSGVTWTTSGKYVTLSGLCTLVDQGYEVFKVFEKTFINAIPSGNYKFIMLIDPGTTTIVNGGKWDLYAKYGTSNSYTKVWAESIQDVGGTYAISFTDNVASLRLRASAGNGTNYNGFKVWFAIFASDVTIVDTEGTVPAEGTYNYANSALKSLSTIDTMQHQSTLKCIRDTKAYIDTTAEKTVQYITPEMFGAIGDGVADDTSALQDCIDYAITNNRVVKGFNKYKTTLPLELFTLNHVEVYLNNLTYTGNNSAVVIDGIGVHFSFDTLESSGKGITFIRDTGACYRHVIEGISLNCVSDCIYIGAEHVYYSTFRIRRVNSSAGNCITFLNGYGGELVFYDFTCGCPQGWVAYMPSSSKFYNFTVEGNCYYGVYDPSQCMFIGWRTREQIDKYERSLLYPEQYDAGPLFKFVNMARASKNYINFVDILRYPCLDVSELTTAVTYESVSDWLNENTQNCIIDTPITGGFIISASLFNQPFGKAMIFGGKRIIIPTHKKSFHVTTAICDLRVLDGNTPIDYQTYGYVNLATDFIADSDTEIYLSASYNAVGFSKFYLDTQGHDVIIKDCNSIKIFDSSEYQGTKFVFECIADTMNWGRFTPFKGNTTYWCYDGTNHYWTIAEDTRERTAIKTRVTWNQIAPAVSLSNWEPRNSSNTLTVNDDEMTLTYGDASSDINASIRDKNAKSYIKDHKYYLAYDICTSFNGTNIGMNVGGNATFGSRSTTAGVYQRLSGIGTKTSDTANERIYMVYTANEITGLTVGATAKVKNPVVIDLTTMYGAGNEPATAHEFERQCAINNIDISTYQAVDNGTEIDWWM